MRSKTTKQLKRNHKYSSRAMDNQYKSMLESDKIHVLEKLQNQITCDYTKIMEDVAKYCKSIMGKAPCKFAIAGMGSLSRKEITPYSDFEHLILLEKSLTNNNDLNYFRWFTVIFHIIIINLQETILPSVAISSLNDTTQPDGDWFYDSITVRGISFDGMMPHASKFPLGTQQHTSSKPWKIELIKSVKDMLKYLGGEESLKNDYHLSEMLTCTCFVYGEKDIYQQFRLGVTEFLKNQNQPQIIEDLKQQISNDLSEFAAKPNILRVQSQPLFNIKRVIYRSTTLFITALARLNKTSATSSFETIRELALNNLITDYEKQKLLFAVALACEIRLRWYMTNESQQDNIQGLNKLVNLVGVHNIFSYFQIAYSLQCDISKRLSLKQVHFFSNLQLSNISLGCCFKNDEQLVAQLNRTQVIAQNSKRFHNFDECLKYLENDEERANADETSVNALTLLHKLADDLYESKCFDDAYEFYKKCLEKLEQKKTEILNKKIRKNMITNFHHRMGVCLLYLDKHQEAFNSLRIILIERIKLSSNINRDLNVALTMNRFGCCLMTMNFHEEALAYLKWSLTIKMNLSQDIESDNMVAYTLHEIGICLTNKKEFHEAMKYFSKALKIQVKSCENTEIERRVAHVLAKIGCCLTSMNNYDQAMLFFKKALKIVKNMSRNFDVDHDIAIIYHEIGFCLLSMDKHDEAKLNMEHALKIIKTVSLDLAQDKCFKEISKRFVDNFQDENVNKNDPPNVDVDETPNPSPRNAQLETFFIASKSSEDVCIYCRYTCS